MYNDDFYVLEPAALHMLQTEMPLIVFIMQKGAISIIYLFILVSWSIIRKKLETKVKLHEIEQTQKQNHHKTFIKKNNRYKISIICELKLLQKHFGLLIKNYIDKPIFIYIFKMYNRLK